MNSIMVVDDEAAITMQLEERLTLMGYKVVGTASSGEEAVAMAYDRSPDIILMDIVMPGKLDGIDASERIKTELEIPVIFLTAYAGDELVRRARYVEPLGYIVKPFHERELTATIEVALYRIKRERERHSLEEQYRSVFYNTSYGIIISDSKFNIVSCNPAAETMFGYSAAEAIKKTLECIIPQRLLGAYQKIIYRAGLAAKSHTAVKSVELAGLRKDGTEFPGEISISVCKILQDTSYISVINDISERKEAENQRRKQEQEAQLASRLTAISDMAGGIAHEVNNQLTGVIGFSQLLAEREDASENVKNYASIISNAGQRIATIVDKLLTFSHQHEPQREYVNINDIIEVAVKLRAYRLEKGNIKTITNLDPGLPLAMADAAQLQQVFLNLIANAETEMQLAHGRGKLIVKTERIDNIIRASFEDDGPGIAEENMDRLFNPFFTTREVGKGMGLGLSVCYGIITEHNGRIYAKSKQGYGATFIVELPLLAEEK